MMPGLQNMGVERDIEGFKEYFENPEFRNYGLKVYQLSSSEKLACTSCVKLVSTKL
jgi:hypothetical protein